jgi:hypothetical protein
VSETAAPMLAAGPRCDHSPACRRTTSRAKKEPRRNRWICRAQAKRIILNTEEPMRASNAATAIVRALIAAIPDDRLRELFIELALTHAGLQIQQREPLPTTDVGADPTRPGTVDASFDACPSEHSSVAGVPPRPNQPKRKAPTATATAASTPCQRKRCGSTPGNSSPGSRGAPSCASSVSPMAPPRSLSATSPCRPASAPRPRPDSSHL